jgi:ribose/xylose/arabinose/galactoside ABC-type transport system permease subunit
MTSVSTAMLPPTQEPKSEKADRLTWLARLRRIFAAREAGIAVVLVLLIVFLSWQSPYFLTASNLVVISRQIALALLIAIGMTFVILAGQIDLSVGSVVALVSVLTGMFMVNFGLPIWLSIVLGLLVGVVVGAINGTIFANSRIPSFVVTLGMLAVARGLALGITTGSTV